MPQDKKPTTESTGQKPPKHWPKDLKFIPPKPDYVERGL